jgi:hypothetical protein
MGKLQDRIEKRLLMIPEVGKIFPTGGSLDRNRSKHIRVQTQIDKEDSVYDVFNLRISIRSDEPIEEAVHVEIMRKAVRKLEEGSIIAKIIPNGFEITNSHLALYNEAVMDFIVITNIEKE